LDKHERYAVVLVDEVRARVFTVFLGEIEEMRETHVHRHLRRAVALLEDVLRQRACARLVLGGPVEVTSALARLLPPRLAERVVGTLRLPIEAPTDEIVRHTLAVIQRAEQEAERTRVAQLFDAGAIGLDATLDALRQGRIWLLLIAEGFRSRGREC